MKTWIKKKGVKACCADLLVKACPLEPVVGGRRVSARHWQSWWGLLLVNHLHLGSRESIPCAIPKRDPAHVPTQLTSLFAPHPQVIEEKRSPSTAPPACWPFKATASPTSLWSALPPWFTPGMLPPRGLCLGVSLCWTVLAPTRTCSDAEWSSTSFRVGDWTATLLPLPHHRIADYSRLAG